MENHDVIGQAAPDAERGGVLRLQGPSDGRPARMALDPRVRAKLERLERTAEGIRMQLLVEADAIDQLRRKCRRSRPGGRRSAPIRGST